MRRVFGTIILVSILFAAANAVASQYVFGVNSNQVTLNGQPFKILGLRCANALISDAKTSELITNLDGFKSYGVNMISVYIMGSRFGDIQGYHPDDTLDPTYAGRLGQIIEAANARGMIVLVGCLYWGTSTAKNLLGGWTQTDANRAISNTVVWLVANNYRNVFVDPDNEGMAQAAKGWSISQMIDAAHSVDGTIMVAYNYTATPPTNADLYIHYSPVVSGKPWLNTEAVPNNAPDNGYWDRYSKETNINTGGAYYNYSRIGRYTSDMKTDMYNQTVSGYQNYNGIGLASTWLQCGPAQGVNGPFMTPCGEATNQNVDVNIDQLNPDAGILWWLEFIQSQLGALNPPAGIVVTQVFFTPDGTNFVLSGTGGSPTGMYAVVTATDLGASVSNWPAISTNLFDLAGNFAVTNPISPSDSQRFYSIHSVSPPQTNTNAQYSLIDPSFENNTAASAGGWNIVNGAVRSTTFSRTPQSPPTGGHCIRLPAGSSTPLAYQGPLNANLTNILAGQQFELTAYAMVTNIIISGFSGVQATFFSASGVNLGTVETSPGNAIFSNKIDSNNTVISTGSVGGQTWIPLSTGVFTAPPGTAYLDVYAISVNVVESNGVAGSWIDDLNLAAVP